MFSYIKDQFKKIQTSDNEPLYRTIANHELAIKQLKEDLSVQKSIILARDQEISHLNTRILELSIQSNRSEPISKGRINIQEAAEIFRSYKIFNVSLSDNYFNLCSVMQAKIYTQESKVQARKWVEENHDCDNFSFALLGYWSEGLKSFAFGYARSLDHAFNVMLDDKRELWICEPQTNSWIKYRENKDPKYFITEVNM